MVFILADYYSEALFLYNLVFWSNLHSFSVISFTRSLTEPSWKNSCLLRHVGSRSPCTVRYCRQTLRTESSRLRQSRALSPQTDGLHRSSVATSLFVTVPCRGALRTGPHP